MKITWEFLISKVPELKELEEWVRSLNSNSIEYGEIRSYFQMKKRLTELVGWGKNPPGYEEVPFEYIEKHGPLKCVAVSEHNEHDEKFDNIKRRERMIKTLPRDERKLYTSKAYDVAWKYLYDLIPVEIKHEFN